MSKYLYEITGEYKDVLRLKKGNTIVHDGSLLGLIVYENNRLEFRINYGENSCCPCELKKINNCIITSPIKEHMIKNKYLYLPLVFTKEEYQELIDNSYIDRNLAENIQELNKDDIFNMMTLQFGFRFNLSEILSIDDIFNNIIAFSEQDEKLQKHISSFKTSNFINIKKLNCNTLKHIALFIYLSNNIYEWGVVVEHNGSFYFKLTDEYGLEIS